MITKINTNAIEPGSITSEMFNNEVFETIKTEVNIQTITEKDISNMGFTKNTGTYSKPQGGIPKTDLTSDIQASLGKADSALQSHQDISGKQDKLVSGTNIKTINGQSILGSGNITISGGGSSSGGNGAYAQVNHGTDNTTFTLTPNTLHVWDEVASLELNLGGEQSGVANEYLFQFTSGSTPTTLILPDNIKWTNDNTPSIVENMIYQVSILNGLATYLEFSNVITKIINMLTYSSNTIGFNYPVASTVTVVFYGRPDGAAASSAPTSVTLVYAPGEQFKKYKSIFSIDSISPSEDDTYIYIY